MTDISAPEGFELFPADGTFNDSIYPLFYKMDEHGMVFAFNVTQKHTNSFGICHGGALMTLMDFALSGAICHKLGIFSGTPTITMSVDFVAKAQLNEWVYAHTEVVRITNTMGFAQGIVKTEKGEAVVRASGSFKLPKSGAVSGVSISDFLQK